MLSVTRHSYCNHNHTEAMIAYTRPTQTGPVNVNMDQGGVNEVLPFLVVLLIMVDLGGGAV